MALFQAVYEVKNYEIKSPLGPRQVRVYTRISIHKEDVPDEVAKELSGVREINSDILIEGVGQVLVQNQHGVYPQPIGFSFGPEVKNYIEAFEQFDKYMEAHVDHLRKEQQESHQRLSLASEEDLRRIDQVAKQTKSGLIIP